MKTGKGKKGEEKVKSSIAKSRIQCRLNKVSRAFSCELSRANINRRIIVVVIIRLFKTGMLTGPVRHEAEAEAEATMYEAEAEAGHVRVHQD